MTPAEVLEKAAELIQERGLAKEDYGVGRKVCMIGAIHLAACGNPDPTFNLSHDHYYLARKASDCLFRFIPSPFLTTQYNDRPSTTKKEAVALLRKAAEGCK